MNQESYQKCLLGIIGTQFAVFPSGLNFATIVWIEWSEMVRSLYVGVLLFRLLRMLSLHLIGILRAKSKTGVLAGYIFPFAVLDVHSMHDVLSLCLYLLTGSYTFAAFGSLKLVEDTCSVR